MTPGDVVVHAAQARLGVRTVASPAAAADTSSDARDECLRRSPAQAIEDSNFLPNIDTPKTFPQLAAAPPRTLIATRPASPSRGVGATIVPHEPHHPGG